MQISLVILAAGFGTRFKSGLKQSAGVGPNGEWILDYSIYDAIKIGFDEVILVIRSDMKDFEEKMNRKYQNRIKISYVYQNIEDIPIEIDLKKIEKPWGTAHAIYSLRNNLNNPFCVIHADDYYGKDALEKMYSFLKNDCNEFNYAMVGYLLNNTLVEGKGVNRAICKIENSYLKEIKEYLNIISLDSENTICSMGLFGFHNNIFDYLENLLIDYLNGSKDKEFLLPDVVNNLICKNINVKVLETNSKWIGITYSEDLEGVKKEFLLKIKRGEYPKSLF